MREVALWLAGAAVAFFVTAAAFLTLASLGARPSEESLQPGPSPPKADPALRLTPNGEQLSSLRALPGQRLDVAVENTSGGDLSNVTLTLGVSSENTALPDARYYRRTLAKLPAGERSTVRFRFDLSPPEGRQGGAPAEAREAPRRILEMRATTPEGVWTVKTAVLPP